MAYRLLLAFMSYAYRNDNGEIWANVAMLAALSATPFLLQAYQSHRTIDLPLNPQNQATLEFNASSNTRHLSVQTQDGKKTPYTVKLENIDEKAHLASVSLSGKAGTQNLTCEAQPQPTIWTPVHVGNTTVMAPIHQADNITCNLDFSQAQRAQASTSTPTPTAGINLSK